MMKRDNREEPEALRPEIGRRGDQMAQSQTESEG
jgi:hypothetical protein